VNIFMVCSRSAYGRVPELRRRREDLGHSVTLRSNFDDPGREGTVEASGAEAYARWKAEMLSLQARKVAANDAVVVLNFDKAEQQNYLGGATFLEVFKAWELGKKIFFVNPLPDNAVTDELAAMNPVVLHGDLSGVR